MVRVKGELWARLLNADIWILVVILMLFAITFFISSDSSAEPSNSPLSAKSSFIDSYYTSLYDTHFLTTYDFYTTCTPGGCVQTASSYIYLETWSAGAIAYGETPPLFMDSSDLFGHGVYYIETSFTPLSDNYYGWKNGNDGHYYWIFNGLFGLYIQDALKLHAHYTWNGGTPQNPNSCPVFDDTVITTLVKNQNYIFGVWVYDIGTMRYYDIYINDQKQYSVITNYKYPEWRFRLGDDDATSGTGNVMGYGSWDYLNIDGHSNLRFYDNFNERNAFNWRDIYRSPASTTIWTVQQDHLYLKSAGANELCYGSTPFIDYYDADKDYLISFDFKFTSDQDKFIVMTNQEIQLILDHGKLYYTSNINNPQNIQICQLYVNTWYNIEIDFNKHNHPNDLYYIYINRILVLQNINAFFNLDSGTNYLSLGDWGAGQTNNGAYWDNIKVWSTDDICPCGFSGGFICGNNIQAFDENFESNIDIEEFDWFSRMNEGSTNAVWQIGTDNQINSHTGTRVAKTILNGNYPNNAYDILWTPSLRLDEMNTGTLEFWIYYNTEANHDGLQITYSQGGTPSNLALGAGLSFYNENNVAAFSGYDNSMEAFAGNSGGWIKKSISIGSLCGSNNGYSNDIRIGFVFRSDGSGVACGVAIDDIRIYGRVNNENTIDYDGELTNWYEYYIFKTSPFNVDTDGDTLSDYTELSEPILNDAAIHSVDDSADPCTKDIFVEIHSMLNPSNGLPYTMDTSVRNELNDHVVSNFATHDINLHPIFYDDTDIGYRWTVNDIVLDDIRDGGGGNLKDPILYTQHHLYPGLTYFCVVVNYINNVSDGNMHLQGYGWCWDHRSHAPFALAYAYITDNATPYGYYEQFAKSFQHELGHCLGLAHYSLDTVNYQNWTPSIPAVTSMISGHGNTHNYLGEDSNTLFSWQQRANKPGHPGEYIWVDESDTLGGWEYGAKFDDTYPNNTIWYYHLYYNSLSDEGDHYL